MKIAILSFYSGHVERGVENWTKELASRLSKEHTVVVFQNGNSKNGKGYEVQQLWSSVNWDIPISEGKLTRRFFIDYWSLIIAKFALKAAVLIWNGKFDVIIPTDGGWESAIFRIVTWLKSIKLVIVGHSGIGWDDRNNLWCFPDRFVALSTFGLEWARSVNPFVKVAYISNGVDIEKFKPEGKKLSLSLQRPIILCVASLTKNKQIDLIIEAVAKLEYYSLLVVGKGELRSKLEKLGKSLLGSRFAIASFRYDEMPEVYRASDILASASMPFLPFEMVLTEAMAANLPVVANNDPIRREIVGDAGILADPQDVESYSKALEKALNTKWSNKPRKQAENFSWNKIARKYLDLLNEL